MSCGACVPCRPRLHVLTGSDGVGGVGGGAKGRELNCVLHKATSAFDVAIFIMCLMDVGEGVSGPFSSPRRSDPSVRA